MTRSRHLRAPSSFRTVAAVLLILMLSAPAGGATSSRFTCAGNPPRQTEDPLSPPCVPFFDGDNGGATASGVTASEIRLVLYNDLGISGDLNTPYDPAEDPDGDLAPYERRHLMRTVKAQVRFFVDRFQTYGRLVRVIARPSTGGPVSACTMRAADASRIVAVDDPFAVVTLGDNLDCFVEKVALLGRPVFAYGGDIDDALQRSYAGLLWSFMPDLKTEVAGSASFICRSLVGGAARFSTDPTLVTHPRRFALIYPTIDQRGPQRKVAAEELRRQVRNRCGLRFARIEPHAEDASATATETMLDFKVAGITTVVCYCVPVQPENTVTKYQNAAGTILYRPEWYWDPISRMDKAMWQQAFGDPTQASFGVSNFWRQPALAEQHHYRAYLSQEPGTVPNERFDHDIYHAFLTAFTAIQSAGPRLTAHTARVGLGTWSAMDASNPFLPQGSLERSGLPGPFSFVDGQTAWWWDPTGTPPDGRLGEGCARLMLEGKNHLRGTWPMGDALMFVSGAPCGGANQRAT